MLQKEKETVSIIIPIYKVEKYLDQCMTSIIYQSYSDLDIIMVDDGSPDSCPELCEQWRKRDSRVQVIHKSNGGLSDARNAGLHLAKGRYIMFVDPDDWISLNMVEEMVAAIEQYEADMSVCQFVNVFPDGRMDINYSGHDGARVIDREEMLRLLAQDEEVTSHVWRKLYKKELIPEDIFPKGKNFEDIMVMPILIEKCVKIVCIDEPYYFYRWNKEGIVRDVTVRNTQDHYDAVIGSCDMIKAICPSVGPEVKKLKLSWEICIWKDILSSENTQYKGYKRIKKFIRRDLKEYSIDEATGKKNKIYLFSIKYTPWTDWTQILFKSSLYRKVSSCLVRYKTIKESKIIKELLKSDRKKFIVLGTPSYGNLGDHALVEGEKSFVRQYFPEYYFCAIPLEHLSALMCYKKYIREDDILSLQAGGNIGSLYPGIHNMQEKVILSLKDRAITIFPQTFYYSKNDDGRKCLANTSRVYKKCKKLQIFVRDRVSFQFVQKELPFVRVDLMPDMALMLSERKSQIVSRQGALICLRNDSERTMSVQEWDEILRFATEQFGHLEQADTHVYHSLTDEQARNEINKLLTKMESVQIVITDRLHGMIFALITKTPCVVAPSKSHKVRGVYDWIKSNEYIQIASCIEELPVAAKKALTADNTVIQRDILYSYFEQMAKIMKERTQRI